ncbi:50S ribosomal protein L29 [Candidatus Woesearchaeota archaeon]|nr:50S ribosomal protein L29 [Candidatus Woesearchaeota archaeon]
MKAKELKLMNEPDLENKVVELKKELMKINSQIAIGTIPKSPSKVREIKRTIAKIHTIKQEKTLSKNKKEVSKRND